MGLVRTKPWLALRDLVIGAAIFVLPICLFFASATAGEVGKETSHSMINLLRTPAIFVRVLMSADWALDTVTVLALAACAVIFYLGGRLTLARSMYLPIAMLVITFIVMPHVLFGVWGVDTRIPIVILFVLIASTRPHLSGLAWECGMFAVLVALLITRSAVLSYNWYAHGQILEEFGTAFGKLPAQSLLFEVNEGPLPSLQDINLNLWQPPLPHVAAFATLEGRVFVPLVFAEPGQQPIRIAGRYASLYRFQDQGPVQVTTGDAFNAVTERVRELAGEVHWTGQVYLLLLDPQNLNLPLPEHTSVIASGTRFLLMAVDAMSDVNQGDQTAGSSRRTEADRL